MTEQPSTKDEAATRVYCSFCGYDQFECQKMIAGPTVFICDSCVRLCVGVLRAESIPYMPMPEEPSTPDASLLRELMEALEKHAVLAHVRRTYGGGEMPCGFSCEICNAETDGDYLRDLVHAESCALSRARKGLGT